MAKLYRIVETGRRLGIDERYIKGKPGSAAWCTGEEATLYPPLKAFDQLMFLKRNAGSFRWELEAVDD